MACDKLHYLPLAAFILFPSTFLGTYIAAVLLGHVEPRFPYISDSGTYSPESCVFGELLNIGALIVLAVVYVRYRQIQEYQRCFSLSPIIIKLNKWSIRFGCVICFGITLVANFQETNVFAVHIFGALMTFGIGTVYFWLQAIISYYMHPMAHGIFLAHIRVGLAMLCTVSYTIASTAGVVARLFYFHGTNPRKWNPTDGGWELHVVSTVNEWITAIAFCCNLLSFAQEFRTIQIEEPHVMLCPEQLNNHRYVLNVEADSPTPVSAVNRPNRST